MDTRLADAERVVCGDRMGNRSNWHGTSTLVAEHPGVAHAVCRFDSEKRGKAAHALDDARS